MYFILLLVLAEVILLVIVHVLLGLVEKSSLTSRGPFFSTFLQKI